MSRLKLFLLGPPRIEFEGVPVEIRRRKVMALLSYLAVTNERQPRETLATLLWPESSHRRARKALRRDLSELNLALVEAWLEADQASVGLRSGFWLDVAQFQSDLAHEATDPQTLMAAVDLYRDDFLTGFTLPDCVAFDEWQFFQTESLRQALGSALERLVRALSGQADYETAITYARRWLALDPLHEAAHSRLMQLYAQAGQQIAARRQYEVCRQTLEDELGISPSEETTALYNDIRTGKLENAGLITPRPLHPRSPAPRRHNLPTQTTTFIGREGELADIQRLLLDEPGCRLLNLVGPGGIGKTRLALAAATQSLGAFPDGAYFVSLTPVGEIEYIVPAMAEALRFTFYGQTDPKDQLLDYLGQKQLLLLMDNFEHLFGGANLLSEILIHAPHVTLLVTSRERLHLQEEWVYEVRGLHFPTVKGETSEVSETSEVLTSYSAVELFTQRARQTEANFAPSATELADIVRICQLVEGMPLGVELAAPWTRTLSCREIAVEIERSLDFLTTPLRNVPERHRSLRAVFEQTWERLSAGEQAVLRQLSVFRGGCTRDAAEQVAGATLAGLSSLLDKALLGRTNTGRYELHELIRQFIEVQLQTDPKAVKQTQDRHCAYFTTFLEQRAADIKGGREKETLEEIAAEIDNVRAAWRWAVVRRNAQALEKSTECLWEFSEIRGMFYEGETIFHQAIAAFTTTTDKHIETEVTERHKNLVGFLLAGQGWLCTRRGGLEEGRVLMEQGLSLLRQASHRDRQKEVISFLYLGFVNLNQGRYAEAEQFGQESLAHLSESGDRWGMAMCLLLLGYASLWKGQLEQAEQLLQACLTVCREIGNLSVRLYANHHLVELASLRGEYVQAKQLLDENVKISQELDDPLGMASTLGELGRLAMTQGEYENALQIVQKSLSILNELGRRYATEKLGHLGTAFRLQGNYEAAERYYQKGLAAAKGVGHQPDIANCLSGLGCLAYNRGEYRRAERLQQKALAIWEELDTELEIPSVLCHLGHVIIAWDENRVAEARQHYKQALQLARKHKLAPIALDVCVGVARLLAQTEEIEQAVQLVTLAEQHEASTFETKEKARQLLTKLADQLPFEAAQAAQDQGQDLWATAREWLAELAGDEGRRGSEAG